MEVKTLNQWADLLLDMGKRNNLIHFRNTKMGTAELVAPDFDTLFRQAGRGAELEVFDPKIEEDDTLELLQEVSQKDGQGDDTKQSEPLTLTREQYLERYEAKLKKGQILIYNTAGKPIQALKNISKRAKTAIEETGVNILYLAFGFIHWTEENEPQHILKAPLLLLPVSVKNESALEPYRIKAIEEDFIVNPTFSYLLQKNYNITLPDYDEEEEIANYLARVGELLARLSWSISLECKLGSFSFQKINMYQDLKEHADKIAASGTVRAMMGETIPSGESDIKTFETSEVLTSPLHNVVDADSSQSEAIRMAKLGKSFVLQGPPGTGKSQTITNIVAECLADGKTVLFVSEKLAALSVVYDKLKKAGMEEFCLELHSHKASKKQVINELCHTLKLPKRALSERAEKELLSKEAAEAKLDCYVEELHKRRPVINQSLYQLFEAVSSLRRSPDIELAINQIKNKDEAYLEKATSALKRYAEFVPSIGADYRRNAWYGFSVPQLPYQVKMQLKNDLPAVQTLCEELEGINTQLREEYELSIENLQKAKALQCFFGLITDSRFLTAELLHRGSAEKAVEAAGKLHRLSEKLHEKKASLDRDFDEGIYALDGSLLYKTLTKKYSGTFSRLFSSEYKGIVNSIRLCHKSGKKPKYADMVTALAILNVYQEAMTEFMRLSNETSFGNGFCGVQTDFATLQAELSKLLSLIAEGIDTESLAKLSVEEFEAKKAYFSKTEESIRLAFAPAEEAEQRLAGQFEPSRFDLRQCALDELKRKLTACIASVEQVENYWEFSKLLQDIEKLELKDFLHYMIAVRVAPDKLSNAYKKAFYSQWIDVLLHEATELMELSRIPHDEAVKQFRQKDLLSFDINKAGIRAAVSAKRPGIDMVAKGSAVAILLREGEKKRKQKSVRQLLSEISELALTLKPCFLMSPLSVSTFLSPEMKFDVVVFDEASQIFPQDAIGAIYRGKQLIVVGDSRQMPPSNFFRADHDMEEDEDESLADFESILDLCSTSLPQRRLKWHYRSRYEQLIAFSNKNFYDNELVTFPSVKKDRLGIGVDYHYVDGVFDRQTKTNAKEAELIVSLIFEHFEKYPERSLGVVAFSVSQQTLIEKLLAKRRIQDSSKEMYFRSDVEEPFFVKNLETVQGDERDTIIFSVAYGRDAQGKLLLNFGPVNRVGGERRLNVAVTRAKHNVQLVSSMHAGDIDLSRTQSVGARMLRDYLSYAEYGAEHMEKRADDSAFEEQAFEFETDICELLRDYGYEVDTKVGCSALRVDIAVKQPDMADYLQEDNYLLAVECDGATYRALPVARDRDRNRQSILENMGWQYYRIWSTDWFRNKAVESKRLLAAVEQTVKNANEKREQQPAPNSLMNTFEETKEETHFAFPIYQKLEVEAIQARYRNNVLRIIRAILDKEAPLSEEWLLKRLLPLYGREKLTGVVVKAFETTLASDTASELVRKDGFLYLKNKEIPMLRVPEGEVERDVRYIALEELANGIRALLEQNVAAEKQGLFMLLAKHLGYSRIGDAMQARFEAALVLMQNELQQNGDMLSLK